MMRLYRTCTIHFIKTRPHGHEPKKQQPLQCDQVHHQKDAADPGLAGIGSARGDFREAVGCLALAELAFNGNAVACVDWALLGQSLALFRRQLRRSPQRLAAKGDAMLLEPTPVGTYAIGAIGQHRSRPDTSAAAVGLALTEQVIGYGERVPMQGVDTGDAVDQRHGKLGPEFDRMTEAASNNRTDMGLVQTDQPIVDAPGARTMQLVL